MESAGQSCDHVVGGRGRRQPASCFEIASATEPVDGKIYIEKINAPMLYLERAIPPRTPLDLAIARGSLLLHESGTFVKLTPAGAEQSSGRG
ncbi:hypothetical protein ABIE49_002508 [Bradyrhizobium sp. OAE829]